MKQIIFTVAMIFASAAQAQIYVGAGVGYGANAASNPPSYTNIDASIRQHGVTASAFVGYRSGMFAIEGGLMSLPDYSGDVGTDNYPAYKGCAVGPTCPQSAHITQNIMSRAYYLRGNVYGSEVKGFEPYAFFGIAKTLTHNHEYGNYNWTENVDYKATMFQHTWFAGAGIQKSLSSQWTMRAEFLAMPKYVEEDHTLRRDAISASVAIQRSF